MELWKPRRPVMRKGNGDVLGLNGAAQLRHAALTESSGSPPFRFLLEAWPWFSPPGPFFCPDFTE